MKSSLPMEFVVSVGDFRSLPGSPSEVAVVGRSNVGKSSLVNAIAGRQGVAHVSKTPGRTRLLNVFAVDGIGTIVDCPGYGYAEVSKATRASWQAMIERYLLERDQLSMVIVLIDGEIGPTRLDLQLLDWLRTNELPHVVVATKHDKVKSAQRSRRARDLATGCKLDVADIVWVSATKGTGIERLRSLMAVWLAHRLEEVTLDGARPPGPPGSLPTHAIRNPHGRVPDCIGTRRPGMGGTIPNRPRSR